MSIAALAAAALALGSSYRAVSAASFCDDPSFMLEWSDDFDSFDTEKWSKVCSDGEEATGDGCLPPFPTHSSSNGAECRSATCVSSAVSIVDGNLVLTSSRDPSNASNWLTGAVKTAGKADWTTDDGTYRLCISAKLPGGGAAPGAGQGLWPAHWMMPADDPCDPDEGEMDIFEMVSGSGDAESTYHWQNGWPNETCAYPDGHDEIWGARELGARWWEGYHEFSVERSATSVAFAIDGVVIANSSAYEPHSSSSRHAPMARRGGADRSVAHAGEGDPGPVPDIKLWPIPFYLIINSAVKHRRLTVPLFSVSAVFLARTLT